MITSVSLTIYFSILTIAAFYSFWHRKYLTAPDRIISILLFITIVGETTAEFFLRKYHNNMYVYHFYNPIEYFLICAYFNAQIGALKKRNYGIWLGLAGTILAVINTCFFQPASTINSNFLLFESTVIIALCVFSFFQMYRQDKELSRSSHFWISSILIFYWAFVFFYWGTYSFFIATLNDFADVIVYSLWGVNIITYLGFAIVFVLYKKMKPTGEG